MIREAFMKLAERFSDEELRIVDEYYKDTFDVLTGLLDDVIESNRSGLQSVASAPHPEN